MDGTNNGVTMFIALRPARVEDFDFCAHHIYAKAT
jgi:hypothetical protein